MRYLCLCFFCLFYLTLSYFYLVQLVIDHHKVHLAVHAIEYSFYFYSTHTDVRIDLEVVNRHCQLKNGHLHSCIV